ncbi:hypothetical protein EDD16DRAFT_1540632 [Pisolithus croceorrhizus]|nr:hypothetical protein EDD16DRAFT_1540632 [Pisolithus croceorrhizus]
MDLAIQFILQLTPFANIHAMDDYADVLTYLVGYWEWDIEAYRTYLNPNLRADNTYIVFCALVFLTMAEWMHFVYSGLTSEELRQRIHAIGHRTFAILAVIPRLGVIIIHNMELVVIADSPVLACALIAASMFPALIFPLVLSGARELRLWISNRWRSQRAPKRNGIEAISLTMTGHSGSNPVVAVKPIVDEIEVSHRHNRHLRSSEPSSTSREEMTFKASPPSMFE